MPCSRIRKVNRDADMNHLENLVFITLNLTKPKTALVFKRQQLLQFVVDGYYICTREPYRPVPTIPLEELLLLDIRVF